MVEPLNLRNLAWALTTFAESVLFVLILWRKLHRSHPAFSFYIVAIIAQSFSIRLIYWRWGAGSMAAWNLGWASQILVLCARWLAITEISRRILQEYSGIRRLAGIILFVLGLAALTYGMATSGGQWQYMTLNAQRAVELCVGVFLVSVFVFARFYRIPIASLERQLALGFCLYSCFLIINFSLYQWRNATQAVLWSFLDVLAFLATLTVWINAVRASLPATVRGTSLTPTSLSPQEYAQLAQQVNTRLNLLSKRLSRLLRFEDPRS